MDSASANSPVIAELPEAPLRDLESRVQALEQAVERLEDSAAVEERVVARLSDRLPQLKAGPAHDSAELEERIVARVTERMPANAPAARATEAAAAPPEPPSIARWGGQWASWLFIDMFREASLLVRMIFDRRYQMAWTTRLVAVVFVPAILLAPWWLPLILFWFPLMWFDVTRELCVVVVNLVLAFALFKALSREVHRYREYVQR